MENMNLVKNKDKALNQKFDEQNMQEILNSSIRTAVDMSQDKESVAGNSYYSVSRTEEDAERIHRMLHNISTGEFKVTETDKARLEAIQGRNLSHLMLNDQKFTGDSKEMSRVKTALSNLEIAMTRQKKSFNENEVDYLAGLYQTAMDECQNYIDTKHPRRETGKRRKAMVQATLARLMKEADGIEIGRRIIADGGSEAKLVKSGVELLSLAAAQRIADVMAKKNAIDEKEELTAEHALLKAAYDVDQKEYDDAVEKKKSTLSLWAKLSFDPDDDDELFDLKEKLKLDTRWRDQQKLLGRINELQKAEKEKEIKEANKKDKKNAGHKDSLKGAAAQIETLPAGLKPLIKLLADGAQPTSLIDNMSKLKAGEKNMLSGMLKIFDALKTFKTGNEEAKTIRVGGEFVSFRQDSYGNLSIFHKGKNIPLENKASECMSVISSDVLSNWKIYGDDVVRNIINDTKTDLTEMTRGDLSRTREYSAKVLFELAGIPRTLLNNFSCGELKSLALEALESKADKKALKKFKQKITKDAEARNASKKEDQVNTVLNLELQRVGIKQTEGVILNVAKKQDNSGWDENERKVRDLAADLIFSKDTWVADGLTKDPAERVRHILIENADALALIVADQFRDKEKQPDGLIEKMLDKLPLDIAGGQLEDMKKAVSEALVKVHGMVLEQVEENLAQNNVTGVAKDVLMKGILTKGGLLPHVKKALEDLDEENMKKLADLDESINDMVEENMAEIQSGFDECIQDVFSKEEDEKEKEKKKTTGLDKEDKDTLKQLKEKEKTGKLNEYEKAKKNRLQHIQDDADGDAADNKLMKDSKENADQLQELLSVLHKEIDDRKRTIADIMKQAENTKKKDRKVIDDTLNKYKQELELFETEEKRVSARYEAENKTINGCNKRIRIREVKRRMDKRLETETLMKEFILKFECGIRESEQKIRENEQRKAELTKQRDALDKTDPKVAEQIKDLKVQIDTCSVNMDIEERNIEKCRKDIASHKENLKSLEKARPKETEKELEKILKDAAKGGEKGQSLFMKNVLKTYFKGMPVLDKRSMLSSAIKNSDPFPPMSAKEKENLSKDQKTTMLSGFLGGMFKGAGPLFQKMLQGLPKSSLPEGLRKAVEDTQDSLAPIPDEVVQAHMEAIRERSNKKITHIDVKKSLGAASVGQAFLCTIFGPGMELGKDVVIKLLRPDVRNRMMREKEVMLNAARMTDAEGKSQSELDEMKRKGRIGGMEATYLGNLQRIEEELDLTIEAKNCQEGQIYDKALKDKENLCDSMKLSDIVEATTDTCMMEIAGTKTVKRYMSDIEEKSQQLLWKFCEKEKEKDKNGRETGREVLARNSDGSYKFRSYLSTAEMTELEAVKGEMAEMLKDAELRTKALAQLVEKWVTQGVFEKGYYHGDLHAGNIMISEKGVTVIDFGNATTLTEEQQTHITKMMVAATMGDVERFRHGFHQLLENTPEEVYQEKREELTLLFKEVMSMGSEDSPAERIAVALVRAQELGIELPPTIANFSSCQMRLQNTLTDMNNTLKAMRNNVNKLNEGLSLEARYTLKDPIAKCLNDYKGRSVQEKKEAVWRYLMEREFTSKEDFRERIRNKAYREDFIEKFNFNAVKDNDEKTDEFKRISGLLSGKQKLTQHDRDMMEAQDIDAVFPVLGAMKETAKKDDQIKGKFITAILRTLDTYLFDIANINDEEVKQEMLEKNAALRGGAPKSFEELVNRLKNSDPAFKDVELAVEVREMDIKLRDYHNALDGGKTSEEDLRKMEDELYEFYKKENEQKVLETIEKNKAEELDGFKAMIPNIDLKQAEEEEKEEAKKKEEKKEDKKEEEEKKDGRNIKFTAKDKLRQNRNNSMDIFGRALKSCENNTFNGPELKKEGEELMKLWSETVESVEGYKKNIDAFKLKFDKVTGLMWEARNRMFHDISGKFSDNVKVEQSDPESFLSIMGGVMKRKKKDLFFRLDFATSFKIWWEGE